MHSMPNLTPLKIVKQEGLIIEKYPRNLTIFRPLDKRRPTVDALVEAFHEHDRTAFAETGHARCIIDLRISGWPTTYSMSVFAFDSTNNTPAGLVESFAFLMADGFAARMMAMLLGQFPPKVRQASRIFFDDTLALAWLHERDQALTPQKQDDLSPTAG